MQGVCYRIVDVGLPLAKLWGGLPWRLTGVVSEKEID